MRCFHEKARKQIEYFDRFVGAPLIAHPDGLSPEQENIQAKGFVRRF
jgi:hypothetical protein